MENRIIADSESLTLKILQLKAERSAQEVEFNQHIKELTQLFNPALTVREERFEQQDRKRDLINLTKTILNMGTDYIVEQSFGRQQRFRAFLSSIMIELVSTPLINKNITKLFSGITKKLFGKTEENE
jgi:hypothetical protein